MALLFLKIGAKISRYCLISQYFVKIFGIFELIYNYSTEKNYVFDN